MPIELIGGPATVVIVLDEVGFKIFAKRGVANQVNDMQGAIAVVNMHDVMIQHLLRDYNRLRDYVAQLEKQVADLDARVAKTTSGLEIFGSDEG